VTEVAFHTNVPDKLGYTCRLLRKAWRQGRRVAVVGDAETLGRLDQALWLFEHEEFLPHLRLRGGDTPLSRTMRTPIWLLDDDSVDVGASVAVNLGPDMLSRPERFERVVEVVSTEVDDAQAGRTRWRHHASAGLAPVNLPYRQSGGDGGDRAAGGA
jgi:DNA polymerase-3 subunit chi